MVDLIVDCINIILFICLFVPLYMFPKIKAKSMEKIPTKEWSERFSLETMPEYSPLADKHTKNYRKLLMNSQLPKSSLIQSKS